MAMTTTAPRPPLGSNDQARFAQLAAATMLYVRNHAAPSLNPDDGNWYAHIRTPSFGVVSFILSDGGMTCMRCDQSGARKFEPVNFTADWTPIDPDVAVLDDALAATDELAIAVMEPDSFVLA